MTDYVGHPLQIRGAEQYVLQGGRGNGMRFLWLRNGLGLEVWLSLDRGGDPSRVIFRGENMGFFAPCGYVAPTFCENRGMQFLRTFTAGFMTTCGLTAVGEPCIDAGEELPMHGTFSSLPADLLAMEETADGLTVTLQVREASLFGHKLLVRRQYDLSYRENTLSLRDRVENYGDRETPFMLLYHCNMGYPLLDETSIVHIPHVSVVPCDEVTAARADRAQRMEKPTSGCGECCYFYDMQEQNGVVRAGIFHPSRQIGVVLDYDKVQLPCFTEWKMMGAGEYALGLEPGNCFPEGRDVVRRKGQLQVLLPGHSADLALNFRFLSDQSSFDEIF